MPKNNRSGEALKKLDISESEQARSLEFTQAELDQVKKENKQIREYLQDIELEIERNRYAITMIEIRKEDTETLIRRKHLIVEGLTEEARGREDIHDETSSTNFSTRWV